MFRKVKDVKYGRATELDENDGRQIQYLNLQVLPGFWLDFMKLRTCVQFVASPT